VVDCGLPLGSGGDAGTPPSPARRLTRRRAPISLRSGDRFGHRPVGEA